MIQLRNLYVYLICVVPLTLSAPVISEGPTPTALRQNGSLDRRAESTYLTWSDMVFISTNTLVQVISHAYMGAGVREGTGMVPLVYTNREGILTTKSDTGSFGYVTSISMIPRPTSCLKQKQSQRSSQLSLLCETVRRELRSSCSLAGMIRGGCTQLCGRASCVHRGTG